MNEGIRSPTLIKPLKAPAARPMPTHRSTPCHSGHPQFTIASPSTDPHNPSTDPTDRSMPPMINTSVMPVATTVRVGIRLASVPRVRPVRNVSLRLPKRISSAIQTAASAPYSPAFRNSVGNRLGAIPS